MTPTEQDKELREKLLNLRITVWKQTNLNGQANLDHDSVDEILQLITADRKRVALEAKIDAVEHILNTMVHEAGGYCDEIDPDDITNYIAELKQELEKL